MDKLKMKTPDRTQENIERIAKLFPNVVTEVEDESAKDAKGTKRYKKVVDFDLLRQMLSGILVEGDDERYRLDWPGKKASLLKANIPITITLRPCREESVNFDTTQNLYIEGDNFEALKILQESYLGKVKVIIIDPPYNTGNDFIYKDDFKKTKDEYEEEIGVEDEEGGKLFRNTDSNGRFHSDWLSMMYERLIVARDLLRDDGVIFIHIDDNEVHNLRKICDEVFGEENFTCTFVVKSNPRGSQSNVFCASVHEKIICYVKDINVHFGFNLPLTSNMVAEYNNEDTKGNFRLLGLRLRGGAWRREQRPLLYYPIFINPESDEISLEESDKYSIKVLPIKPTTGEDGTWRWGKQKLKENISQIVAKKILRNDSIIWDIYQKDYLQFSSGEQKGTKPKTIWDEKEVNYQNGTVEVNMIFGQNVFDFPKPTFIVNRLLRMATNPSDDIILDFFSGSATTAHAVMQLNAEDGGRRKFIMVQLDEKTAENSEAYKAGYKTIADIGKERIRRAGKKILEELATKNTKSTKKDNGNLGLFDDADKLNNLSSVLCISWQKNLDIGFRVYKTADTNMKEVFYHPYELDQKQLPVFQNNIKEDRTPEDLLTQVILDLGLELSLPIEQKIMYGNNVIILQTNALVACFDNDIDFKIIDEIADLKPLKVVFKDASFKDDKDRINVEERFKRLSPETKVTVI